MLPSFPTETFPTMAAWIEGPDFTVCFHCALYIKIDNQTK